MLTECVCFFLPKIQKFAQAELEVYGIQRMS